MRLPLLDLSTYIVSPLRAVRSVTSLGFLVPCAYNIAYIGTNVKM